MGRNQKGIQESQNVKGSMNSGAGRKFRKSAKFSHHGTKFSASSFSASAPSFSASAPSFLLILIYNVEFDSNFSCLDQLDNLGINSL